MNHLIESLGKALTLTEKLSGKWQRDPRTKRMWRNYGFDLIGEVVPEDGGSFRWQLVQEDGGRPRSGKFVAKGTAKSLDEAYRKCDSKAGHHVKAWKKSPLYQAWSEDVGQDYDDALDEMRIRTVTKVDGEARRDTKALLKGRNGLLLRKLYKNWLRSSRGSEGFAEFKKAMQAMLAVTASLPEAFWTDDEYALDEDALDAMLDEALVDEGGDGSCNI